jgi:hypothetical protein
MPRALRLAAAILALGAGCVDGPPADLCDGGPCPPERTVAEVLQSSRSRMMDLLFVVDDTAGIAPYQSMLADGFAGDASVLEGLIGGVPNLHAGFISSSLGAGSPETRGPDCDLAAPAAYATVDSCGQLVNFPGALEATFSCLGDFGAASAAPAEPLAALRRMLESPPAGWEGFLRPDATLVIVVVAGEDDASSGTVAETIDFVRSLKADPANDVLISVVVPPTASDCSLADPTSSYPRLTGFAEAVGANGLIATLCGNGVPDALLTVATTLASTALPPCIHGVRDVDPSTPGVQASCAVEQTITRADGTTTTSVLPSCDQAAAPCWWVQPPSALAAPYCPGGVSFGVTEASDYCPECLTRTQIECLGCIDPADPACQGS